MEVNPRQQVLVDTDALVALVKPDDSNHRKATRLAAQAQKNKIDFFISHYTVSEVCTVLSYKVSQRAAVEFLASVYTLDITVLEVTEEVFKKAEEIFVQQVKKGTSYFDCVNIALMRHHSFHQLFSFDNMYVQNGVSIYS